MAKLIQPSFAGGEVSVPVGARVDLTKRAIAVEEADNYIATLTGSMDSRPGLEFVSRAKGTGTTRLLPFEFSVDETTVLEFGAQYVRFHVAGAQVLDSSTVDAIEGATQANPVVVTMTGHSFSDGDEVYIADVVGMTELNGRNFLVSASTANTISLQDLDGNNVDGTGYTAYTSGGACTTVYEVATPYSAADLFDIRYAQNADVVTLAHPDYQERELTRTADDNWELSVISFEPQQAAPSALSGEADTLVQTLSISGITQANPGVLTYSGTIFPDADTTATARELQDGDRVFITGVVGMTELNNFTFKVEKISSTTFSLKSVDDGSDIDTTAYTAYTSGGTIEYAPRQRNYAVTAVNGTTGEESLIAASSSTVSITGATKADPVVITTDGGHGMRSGEGILIDNVVGMTELNGERFIVTVLSPETFSLQWPGGTDVDGTVFTTYTSGGTLAPLFTRVISSKTAEWKNSIFWTGVADAEIYNVYASTGGDYGFIGSTDKLAFGDDNIGPDTALTPPRSRDPFRSKGVAGETFPGAVAFFDQRRVFGRTGNDPNRFFATSVGNIYNFASSVPTQDDDPLIATIVSPKINDIEHIVALTDLIILTSGGEFRVFGGDRGTLTPSTMQIKAQSYYGSTKIPPLLAGEVGLICCPGWVIRDFSYQFADDKFVGKDLTVLARHLFRGYSLVDWGFSTAPHSVAWVVRNDGTALAFTYLPEQDVFAWTRATTCGNFKSVAVVREGSDDVPYFLVERTVNGNTFQTIERMVPHSFTDLHDAYCVDAGLTLDTPLTITNMTAADPVVVTTQSAHGLSNGATVDISDVLETVATSVSSKKEAKSSDYNGVGFTVANVTATTFELQSDGVNYDGSGFAAYSSGGVAREAVTTVGGLWHLEGASVVAAANGLPVAETTVTNGQITIPDAASRVHVGLPYVARLKTLPLSSYADGQTIQGKAQNINRLTLGVHHTRGLWTGPELDLMRECPCPVPTGRTPAAFGGTARDVTLKGSWSKNKQVIVEQRDPLPISITSLIPDAIIGGN